MWPVRGNSSGVRIGAFQMRSALRACMEEPAR